MAGLENLSAKSKVLIRKWLNSYIWNLAAILILIRVSKCCTKQNSGTFWALCRDWSQPQQEPQGNGNAALDWCQLIAGDGARALLRPCHTKPAPSTRIQFQPQSTGSLSAQGVPLFCWLLTCRRKANAGVPFPVSQASVNSWPASSPCSSTNFWKSQLPASSLLPHALGMPCLLPV